MSESTAATPEAPLPHVPPTPAAATTPSFSPKDIVTLCLSSLALLVSLSTFVVGRLDAAKLRKKEMHQAYWLGQHLWGGTVFWIQAAKLDPTQREAWFQDPTVASETNQVQQLSNLLDLGFTDTHQLFPLPNSAMTLQEFSQKEEVEFPFREVISRISLTRNRHTLVAFELGYINLHWSMIVKAAKGIQWPPGNLSRNIQREHLR